MSERARLPVEFFPHHANLAREHRIDLEKRLKTHSAATAVCTSTLELGIDIGDIACVAQIGAPFSVASLRQRLGRSGRRQDQPAVLRMYAIEREPDVDSHLLTRLHLGLVRSVAMVELLIDGWCEPPSPQALHLSTLTQQILSVIAQHGGSSAGRLFTILCKRGPFRLVNPRLFARLLRHLGSADVALIEQAPDGTLLLGSRGERLVEHYSFFAVFQTPVEFRVFASGKLLGVIPVTTILAPDMTIIFSGRRWRIVEIRDQERVIEVTRDRTGRPPPFGGSGGQVHDQVVLKMKDVLADERIPVYLDETAARLLGDARSEYRRSGLGRCFVIRTGERSQLIATWSGTVKAATLALALQAMGYSVEIHDGFLDVRYAASMQPAEAALSALAGSQPMSGSRLFADKDQVNLANEKYHTYLSQDLLVEDVTSSRLDLPGLPQLSRRLLQRADTMEA